MPIKKKKKSSGLLPVRKSTVSVLVLTVLIAVVGYLVVAGNVSKTDASLTAPKGTAERSDQISGAELNQEQSLDDDYDIQHQANVRGDAGTLSQVGEVVRDDE